MILTDKAKNDIEQLFHYPFIIGTHLSYSMEVLRRIDDVISITPPSRGRSTIPGIGIYEHNVVHGRVVILRFIWLTPIRRFFYTKSNFITFNSNGNIASVHPSFYSIRNEEFFQCDNAYLVVSRMYRGRLLFNFQDTSGRIISDIDFTQVKPFTENNNMIARGYAPNRRCYAVYEDGSREEVNESKDVIFGKKIYLTETELKHIITESVRRIVKEYEPWNNGNYFRGGGITDWEREELKKSYNYYLSQTNDEYPTMFTFNNWITEKEGEATKKGLGAQWPTYYPRFSKI